MQEERRSNYTGFVETIINRLGFSAPMNTEIVIKEKSNASV